MKTFKLKLIPFLLISSAFAFQKGFAQEINFNSYNTYTITLEKVNLEKLVFEGPIISNSGLHSVELADAVILEIEGVKFLDVLASITQVSGGGGFNP